MRENEVVNLIGIVLTWIAIVIIVVCLCRFMGWRLPVRTTAIIKLPLSSEGGDLQ